MKALSYFVPLETNLRKCRQKLYVSQEKSTINKMHIFKETEMKKEKKRQGKRDRKIQRDSMTGRQMRSTQKFNTMTK